jgi:hypothetical protein
LRSIFELQNVELDSDASSFTFLTEDSFLVAHAHGSASPSLRIFKLPQRILDPTIECACLSELQPSVIMRFPEAIPRSFSDTRALCRSYPLPSGRQWRPPVLKEGPGLYALPEQCVAFRATEMDRIVTCSWMYTMTSGSPVEGVHAHTEEAQLLITHVSSLLSFFDKAKYRHLPLEIPWSEWSYLARLTMDRYRGPWYSPTYGHRYVMPTWNNPFRDEFSIVVLDFNDHALRRELGDQAFHRSLDQARDQTRDGGENNKGERVLITEQTVLASSVYRTPPGSSLPYVEIRSHPRLGRFRGLMLVSRFEENIGLWLDSEPYHLERRTHCQRFCTFPIFHLISA